MAIKVISDIHGEYEALREQLEPDDTALLLGDYLNLIDFRTLDGILARVYSTEEVKRVLEMIAQGNKQLALARIRDAVGGSPEKSELVRQMIAESYEEFFESIPCRCYMLYGNTDGPHVMERYVSGRVEMIECGVQRIDGIRVGFVSGAPRGPWTAGLPGEMEQARYDDMVRSLGPVDVLCTHFPPSIPELTFDKMANRDEIGSPALLSYIDRYAPAYHYFGHVHSPRESCCVRGETKVVNAGYFRAHKEALIHPAECPPPN